MPLVPHCCHSRAADTNFRPVCFPISTVISQSVSQAKTLRFILILLFSFPTASPLSNSRPFFRFILDPTSFCKIHLDAPRPSVRPPPHLGTLHPLPIPHLVLSPWTHRLHSALGTAGPGPASRPPSSLLCTRSALPPELGKARSPYQ